MLAISVKVGTKYAWNNNFVGDQICQQSQTVRIETVYACNFGHERDQICMLSWFKRGPYMPAIVSDGDHICLQSRFFKWLFDTRRSHSRYFKKIRDCRHIWSQTKLLWEAYLVPNLTDIAGILGPPYKYTDLKSKIYGPWIIIWVIERTEYIRSLGR